MKGIEFGKPHYSRNEYSKDVSVQVFNPSNNETVQLTAYRFKSRLPFQKSPAGATMETSKEIPGRGRTLVKSVDLVDGDFRTLGGALRVGEKVLEKRLTPKIN